MRKMMPFAFPAALALLLGLASTPIAPASSPAQVQKPALTTAERWADAVVEVLTDPKLYQYTEKTLPPRLNHLVRLAPLPPPAYGVLEGSNPSEGILFVSINFTGKGVQDIEFTMPGKDAQGHAVFPAVRRRLEKRLRSPWIESWDEEDPDGPHISWRRGRTKFVMRLSTVIGPNLDAAVSVVAGVEQADSE